MDYDVDRAEYLSCDEEGLKKLLENSLKNDFILRREQGGFHLLERHRIRIDFLAYPKAHLIERDFEPLWFGIEVKSPAVKIEPQKNVLDLIKQAIDYAESQFDEIIPNFILVFPSMYHFIHAQDRLNAEFKNFLYYFRSFMQRMKVGTLHIHSPGDWSIRFGSQRYFSSKRGRGNVKNLGTKRYIGSV